MNRIFVKAEPSVYLGWAIVTASASFLACLEQRVAGLEAHSLCCLPDT